MKKIEAKIIADSVNKQGDRVTTYLLTFPRFILSELNTHRVFSKNSASSRAIPFIKMVKMVEEDPFIPIAWQKDHKGMQGTEYWNEEDSDKITLEWLQARDKAAYQARMLHYAGVTKQLCNRLLEPFMWHTVLLTGTEFTNFFNLRCPRYETKFGCFYSKKDARDTEVDITDRNPNVDILESPDLDDTLSWLQLDKAQAEIHMQALAEAMWDAYNKHTPKLLKEGEWHIPFGDDITMSILDQQDIAIKFPNIHSTEDLKIKIATARCARLSYNTFDGEIDYEKDLKLHDSLLASGHASPFEHCCRALYDKEYDNCGKLIPLEDGAIGFQKGWVDNFRGFKSYRRILNF